MRVKLGFESRNTNQLLSKWGAEIRSLFFLGDEDFKVRLWGFELPDISEFPVGGVTFSGLDIKSANFIHVGQLCLWNLAFNIQPSANLTGVLISNIFGVRLPRPIYEGTGALTAFGRIWIWRATAFSTINMEVPPQLTYYKGGICIRPGLTPAPGGAFYTYGGTMPTKFELTGFYFTKDLPRR